MQPHGSMLPAVVIYEGYPELEGLVLVLRLRRRARSRWGLRWMLILNIRRKARRYKMTQRTIDYEVGVFSRRIETLQLWRVKDLDFRQSFMERIWNVGQIAMCFGEPCGTVAVRRRARYSRGRAGGRIRFA